MGNNKEARRIQYNLVLSLDIITKQDILPVCDIQKLRIVCKGFNNRNRQETPKGRIGNIKLYPTQVRVHERVSKILDSNRSVLLTAPYSYGKTIIGLLSIFGMTGEKRKHTLPVLIVTEREAINTWETEIRKLFPGAYVNKKYSKVWSLSKAKHRKNIDNLPSTCKVIISTFLQLKHITNQAFSHIVIDEPQKISRNASRVFNTIKNKGCLYLTASPTFKVPGVYNIVVNRVFRDILNNTASNIKIKYFITLTNTTEEELIHLIKHYFTRHRKGIIYLHSMNDVNKFMIDYKDVFNMYKFVASHTKVDAFWKNKKKSLLLVPQGISESINLKGEFMIINNLHHCSDATYAQMVARLPRLDNPVNQVKIHVIATPSDSFKLLYYEARRRDGRLPPSQPVLMRIANNICNQYGYDPVELDLGDIANLYLIASNERVEHSLPVSKRELIIKNTILSQEGIYKY